MTSRISYKKIAREDLRRRIWMLALSCLGNVLALPVAFLIANRNYLELIDRRIDTVGAEELFLTYYSRFFDSPGLACISFIAIAGALIVGICGFRYLYSRKMTDLYHSIPIKRGHMFLIIYLNGLLIFLIPLLLSTGILLLLMIANMASYGALSSFGAIALSALQLLGLTAINYLIVYHLCLVCVMLSGNAFNAICLTALFGTAVAACFGIFGMLCEAFLDNFHSMGIAWEQIAWASPLVSPFFLINDFSATHAGVLFSYLSNSMFEHPLIIRIGSLLVMIANFAVAYLLYLKRPSETAEHGVDKKSAQSIARITMTCVAGLFGSYIFLMILDREAIGWHLFGIILCGCLAFGVTDIVLHMNFHSFFAHKKQMAASLALLCGLFLIFAFDLTGYDKRLPAQKHIKSAEIYVNGYYDEGRHHSFTEDGRMLANDSYFNTLPYSDLDVLYPLLEQLTDENHEELDNWCCYIDIVMDTTFGPFRRSYRITEEDKEALRPLIESREYLATSFPASMGLLPAPASMVVSSNLIYSEEYTAASEQIQTLWNAYCSDFSKHATIEELETGMRVGSLELQYPYQRDDYDPGSFYRFDLPVYAHYTETIRAMKEYFPHLSLEMEDLEILSLTVSSDKLSLFGITEEPEAESKDQKTTAAYTAPQIAATAEYYNTFLIDEPEELAALLPYLQPGDYYSNRFESVDSMTYVGRLSSSNGQSIACYIDNDELPLPLPASIKEALEEAAAKLTTP